MLQVTQTTNTETNIQVTVYQYGAKFHCVMKDLDSDQIVPTVTIFDSRIKAVEYATKCVGN